MPGRIRYHTVPFLVYFFCLWVFKNYFYFFSFFNLVFWFFILFPLQLYLRIIPRDTKPRLSLLHKISCMSSEKSVPALFLHLSKGIFELCTPCPTDFDPHRICKLSKGTLVYNTMIRWLNFTSSNNQQTGTFTF